MAARLGSHDRDTHTHTHTNAKKKKKENLKRWTAQPGPIPTGVLCVIYRRCYNTPESEPWLWLAGRSRHRWDHLHTWSEWWHVRVHGKAWLRLRLIDGRIVWRGFTSFPGALGDPRHSDHRGSASVSGRWLRINPPLWWPGCPQGSPTSPSPASSTAHTHARHFLLDWIKIRGMIAKTLLGISHLNLTSKQFSSMMFFKFA